MRKVLKHPEPAILAQSRDDWETHLAEKPTDHNKNRYRHPEIKAALLAETHGKCVYCESKVGHNCPGDVEHKIPKSKRLDLIFDWDNMTVACSECNRRKLDYYDPSCMFLDPNNDDVEDLIVHLGPVLFNRPGQQRSEVTIRILELNHSGRKELFARKLEKLEEIRNLCERIATEKNKVLKEFMLEDLREHISVSAEFSGMIKAYIEALPEAWANKDLQSTATQVVPSPSMSSNKGFSPEPPRAVMQPH